MKKIFSIFLTLTAALAVFSCQTEKDADGSQYLAGPALEIVSKEVVFAPQGGSGSIVINTRETVSASADRSWATVTVAGNRVTVTVDRNESLESRYATIKLAAGGATAEVTAQQFGINSAHAWDDTYTFPYGGGELDLPYGENGTVWVDVSETNWVSAQVDEENHLIHFTVAKSIYNYERVGHVTVTIGEDYVRELTFIQQPNPAGLNPGEQEPVEFTVQPVWTPKYIQPSDPNDPVSTVGVDVAEGQSGGRYFIQVVSQADFNAAGADEQIFLNRNAAAWAAASPRLFRASSTMEIEKLDIGSYRVYAIGVNNDNEVNYTYAVATFNVTKVLSPYEKFLGTWSYNRGGEEDIWTITEKVPNQSYNITGIDGNTTVTAEAVFNADGTMTLRAQANLGENTVNTDAGQVTGDAAIYGRILYNGSEYYVSGTYPIFIATLNADASEAALAPQTVSTNVGDFDLIGFSLYTIVGQSAYAVITKGSLPATIKHLTQGSGTDPGDDPGDNPDPGTGAYGKWIGTWTIGADSFTLSQKVANSSYVMNGFGDFDVEVGFDPSTGGIRFFGQQLDEDDDYTYVFAGLDDADYFETGDANNGNLLATASLSSDGKTASIVTHEYDAVYSGQTWHEVIVQVTIWGLPTDPNDQYVYTFNNIPKVDIPSTMTKASGASVTAVRSAGYDLSLNAFFPITTTYVDGPAVPYKRK